MKSILAIALLAAPSLLAHGSEPGDWHAAVASDTPIKTLDDDARAQLAAMLARYREQGFGPRLDTGQLAPILADMSFAPAAPETWWERAWRWLARQLEDRGWTIPAEWLEALATVGQSSSFEWIARISMLVLVVLAAVVVFLELRRLHWRRQRRRRPTALDSAPPRSTMTWEAIAALPPRDRPGAALSIVVASLAATAPALAAAGVTHREIATEAARLAPPARRSLVRLARLAEHARFGRWSPDADRGNEAIALGRAILRGARA